MRNPLRRLTALSALFVLTASALTAQETRKPDTNPTSINATATELIVQEVPLSYPLSAQFIVIPKDAARTKPVPTETQTANRSSELDGDPGQKEKAVTKSEIPVQRSTPAPIASVWAICSFPMMAIFRENKNGFSSVVVSTLWGSAAHNEVVEDGHTQILSKQTAKTLPLDTIDVRILCSVPEGQQADDRKPGRPDKVAMQEALCKRVSAASQLTLSANK